LSGGGNWHIISRGLADGGGAAVGVVQYVQTLAEVQHHTMPNTVLLVDVIEGAGC
jgi:hypothetical protein